MKVSVIDLGYNSLKLVNYDVQRDKSFSAYSQRSILARLGQGLDETGFLADDAVLRTIGALRMLREMVNLDSIGTVLPVATSAVRDAGNQAQFLKHAYRETGFRFKVLSSKEEALYSFAGSNKSTSVSSGLFFDLGGGSLETVISQNSNVKKLSSVPLGGLRLTDLYASDNGTFTKKNYARMSERIIELLPEKKDLSGLNKPDLVGVGGTIRAMARYHQMITKYPLDKLHNYSLKSNSVGRVHQFLRRLKLKQIGKIPVIGQDRARSIVAGTLVVDLMMRKFGFKRLIVSNHGLRDGVLSAFLQDPASYRNGSVETILPKIKRGRPLRLSRHSEHAVKLLWSYYLLSRRETSIIRQGLAWVLGDLPLYNPETLFYINVNADSVLSHSEQLLVALSIVRARGLRGSDWIFARYKDMLDKNAKDSIKRVSAVIRLLEILERTGSKMGLSIHGHEPATMRIRPGHTGFPEDLFKNALKDFEAAFHQQTRYSLRHHPVQEPGSQAVITEAS